MEGGSRVPSRMMCDFEGFDAPFFGAMICAF